jgi:hypothetical protein
MKKKGKGLLANEEGAICLGKRRKNESPGGRFGTEN